jgi:hypothetical protein
MAKASQKEAAQQGQGQEYANRLQDYGNLMGVNPWYQTRVNNAQSQNLAGMTYTTSSPAVGSISYVASDLG